ncbi:hypothetical protein [Sphingomonas sp.]|uniref:hypothetical protein n=1 Tax=Sphingomonas sp. TaxID=28214 RepID=UPI00286EAD89|nr:hypothetical protein [Sphingomonas sp.]
MRIALTLALSAGLLVAMPAVAANVEPSKAAPSSRNPDDKICEDITIVGSRLAVKRVCATRAQWAEKRRRDRDLVDQAQRSPCVVVQIDHGKQVC